MIKLFEIDRLKLNYFPIVFSLLFFIMSNFYCKNNNRVYYKNDSSLYTLRIDFMTIDSIWLFTNMDSLSTGMSRVFPEYNKEYFQKELSKAYFDKNRYFLLKRNFSFEKLQELKSLSVFEKRKLKYGFIVQKR
jgi:hypothetical protein